MKIHFSLIFILVSIFNSYFLSQNRTNNWVLPGNLILDFNSNPPVCNILGNLQTTESSTSISNKTGELILYSNGDCILDGLNQVLQNGNNLAPGLSNHIQSTTQGSLIVPFLENDSMFYMFTNSRDYGKTFCNSFLTYSTIKKGSNNGYYILNKQNIISTDTLSEKMVVTKHCNGKYYWLIVIKYTGAEKLNDGLLQMTKCVFYSYLIDDFGVRSCPIQTGFDFAPPQIGQMKFNSTGTQLAYATDEKLYIFDFNNSTGVVSSSKIFDYDFENGYGIEWSKDGNIIYVNEKQVELATGNVYHTQNKNVTQLQIAENGKIYGFQNSEIYSFDNPTSSVECFQNSFGLISPTRTKLFEIANPNSLNSSCNLNTNFIDTLNSTNSLMIALPNLPHFLIFEDSIDFTYNGSCLSDTFQFGMINNLIPDSIYWEFIDENQTSSSQFPTLVFNNSGISEVKCTVYYGGIAHSISKCISIIGDNTDFFDNEIEICPGENIILTATEYIPSNYFWSNGDTTATTTLNQPGTYTLQTKNKCGTFIDQVTIKTPLDCLSEIIIPNVFTLNSDNVNDDFSIRVNNISSLKFSVLNRWGETISQGNFSSTTTKPYHWVEIPIWNGTCVNGQTVNEGVYFCIIDAINNSGECIKQQGFFHLIK